MNGVPHLVVAALVAATIMPAAADGPDVPRLVEQAAAAGVTHVYDGPWEHFVGGGVAVFDCNGDRRPDLVFAGGANPARLFVNRSTPGDDLWFEERPLLVDDAAIEGVTGAYALDLDGDGPLDLVLLRVGRNALLEGAGDCTFAPANRLWAFDGGREWTTAFAATFEADLPFPTLAFGHYVDRSQPGAPWGTCHENTLLRPADRTAPRYDEPLALSPGHCALSMLFTDWSNSGEPALRITNDRQYHIDGEDQLWRVTPGAVPRLFRRSDGWQSLRIWGMGIAEADLAGTGQPAYALTSMGDTKLQVLDPEAAEGEPAYLDVAYDRGATAHRPYVGADQRPSTGWHVEFDDVNNDGLLDLFIAKGNVEAMPDFAAYDPDNLLLGTWPGRFVEVGDRAGVARDTRGRGGAVVDLDLDGQLDLVVVNRGDPVSLFRNLGAERGFGPIPMGNWLQLELRQPPPNRHAVGARVAVRIGTRTLVRTVTVGGGHASGHLGWVHVGLGTAERAQVRVRWPDGSWSHAYRVFANNFAILDRDAADARYWYPETSTTAPVRPVQR
ncbi:MAG: CRTAC1 family protein [Pseudomonadota bacterium]